MKPVAVTPLYPTNAEAITPGAGKFAPSIIWADTGGTVTVVPFDNDDADTVSFVIPDASAVPVMCKKVTAVVGAAGLKRLW